MRTCALCNNMVDADHEYCHKHRICAPTYGMTQQEFNDRYRVGKDMVADHRDGAIEVPLTNLWTKEEDKAKLRDLPAVDENIVKNMTARGQGQPIPVAPAYDIGPGHYYVLSGFRRVAAARKLCWDKVWVTVVGKPGSKFWDNLRSTINPLAWGRQAQSAIEAGVPLDDVVRESQLPRSVVLDRLAMAKDKVVPMEEMLAEVKRAESHGKVLGRQEKAQEELDRALATRMLRPCVKKCIDGCKNVPMGKFCPQHASPKSRGLKLCLEPGCKVWISGKPEKARAFFVECEHFCKKHARFIDVDGHEKPRGYDSYPLRDRDGDPIWVGARFQVTKVHDLEVGHLLNCISLLERAAEKRQKYTGKPVEETLKELPKHAMLIAELKQRDACKLCKGGLIIVGESGSRVPEATDQDAIDYGWKHAYCACRAGQERKATDAIAEQSQGKSKAAILVLAMAFVTALLNAPAASTVVMEFLHGVHERLKAMGVL